MSALKTVRDAYFDLMAKCLTGYLYADPPSKEHDFGDYNKEVRAIGCDWPSNAQTMIGLHRMNNIKELVEDVLQSNVPGGFLEAGVWRGGACMYAKAIFNAYEAGDRKVYVADSFCGLPEPSPDEYPADEGLDLFKYETLAVSQEDVQKNFEDYGLLDDNVVFIKGFFADSLPKADVGELAVLRADGDLYESTIQILEALYDRVSVGGYVIIDDYHTIGACKLATDEFRERNGVTDEIVEIDGMGVYWQKK